MLHDLLTWRDARLDRAEVLYWHTAIGEEVDFVIEAGDRLLPIEVKATERPASPRRSQFAHLPRRVWRQGKGGPVAPRWNPRVAGARRAGCALVEVL